VVVQSPPPASTDKKGTTPTTTPGLIVAAPGSTVVVSNPPPAPAAKKDATPPNTFTAEDKLSIVHELVERAKDQSLTALARVGAIDALGSIGGDATVAYDIARGLGQVIDKEFDVAGAAFNKTNSEFICYHTVKALGLLGWGAKPTLSKLQLLRGQNVILDSAIDHAVNAIRTGPVPAKPQAADGN
jgi:hypothetical protein